jgi:hypothetical protein
LVYFQFLFKLKEVLAETCLRIAANETKSGSCTFVFDTLAYTRRNCRTPERVNDAYPLHYRVREVVALQG